MTAIQWDTRSSKTLRQQLEKMAGNDRGRPDLPETTERQPAKRPQGPALKRTACAMANPAGQARIKPSATEQAAGHRLMD
jgi:hypothetical protein